MKKCLNCGKEFQPASTNQVYCCAKCGRKYRSKGLHIPRWVPEFFICMNCGKEVLTEGSTRDRRKIFCSYECQDKFWKAKYKKYK